MWTMILVMINPSNLGCSALKVYPYRDFACGVATPQDEVTKTVRDRQVGS